MGKITWKGTTLIAPVPPVLVCVGDEEKNNVFTVGWTGIINTQPPKTYISVRPERYSYEFLEKTKEFTINLATSKIVAAVDTCGVKTGKKLDKFRETGLTPIKSEIVKAPIIRECPINLECKIFEALELGTHTMFLADILNVHVDESLINKDGRLMIEKADLLAYAHGRYFELGKSLMTFGQSVRKKKKR